MSKFKDNKMPYILIALENNQETTETTLKGTENEVSTLPTILTNEIAKKYDISLHDLFLLMLEALTIGGDETVWK